MLPTVAPVTCRATGLAYTVKRYVPRSAIAMASVCVCPPIDSVTQDTIVIRHASADALMLVSKQSRSRPAKTLLRPEQKKEELKTEHEHMGRP